MGNNFQVKQFSAGSCYSYILDSEGEALIVDPHVSLLDEYTGYLKKKRLRLKSVVDTHTHADHFSLAAVLKKKFNVSVIMHENAISDVADRRLKDGDEIKFGGATLRVLYTPGHTDDAISLYGGGKIFTGDVLLIGSVGRTDFQNGSPESMFETLGKLRALPAETAVFPGHDYHGREKSTIGHEINTNPFLFEKNRDTFLSKARAKELPKPFNIDNIIRVNRKGEAASLETITPKEAKALVDTNPDWKLLDVRSQSEFAEQHIDGSVNVPIDNLPARTQELARSGSGYIVLCRTGNRSPMAADMLIQSGVANVKVMRGGITKWRKDGLKIIKGEGSLSVERQIRIIAGFLVLTGIILSVLFHPAFIALSIFVAAGLLYAGITDNCMMGMLLMKLPYNKKALREKLSGGTCSISV